MAFAVNSSLCLLVTVALCSLRWVGAAASVGTAGSAVHSDKQSISSTAAGAATAAAVAARKGLLSPHVTAAVLPAHGSTFDEAALAAYSTAQRLAAFSSSLILMMPPAPDAASQSSFKKHLDDAQLPPQLQHDIVWTGDASAARNAAADVAHANGAAWLFVAVAGDAVTVQDGGLVLQQLQESCESEQLLACHSSLQDPWAQACLFKLPLQGHFEGPATPIYIPNARSNSRSSSSNSGHQTKQASAECPPGGGQPNRLTLAGILYQPAAPSVDQLRSIVSLLRQHLSSSPPHASWWHLQLSEAFEALGSTQLAEQQLYAAYDAATSRRLAAAAMYKLAELRIGAGDMQGAIAAAARGIARHVTPDLLWIAALASYRAANDQAAISWSEMAARVACAEGVCSVDRPAAFADVATWYEKPYDVMRWAYKRLSSQQSSSAAAEAAAERSWAAAAALREQQVAGNSSSRFIVLGLQALPLLQLQEGIEDAFAPPPAPVKPRIASSITTAHRPELFRRTWHSFRARCLDCHELVTKWFAVDDGSTTQALAQMQQDAPPGSVTWLDKKPKQAGHVGSLNRLLQEVHALGFDYLLHLEDDWYFTSDNEFVSKALRIMNHDPSIAQVLFNENYADTDADWERELIAPAQQQRTTLDGLPYVQHVFGGPHGLRELGEYEATHAHGKLSNYHWPGFSLRPGLWRLSAMQEVGRFTAGMQFEHKYGMKLHAAGYKVAFFSGVSAVHLAPTAVWLQDRQAHMDAVFSRHQLRLQRTPGQQRSAYDAAIAWR